MQCSDLYDTDEREDSTLPIRSCLLRYNHRTTNRSFASVFAVIDVILFASVVLLAQPTYAQGLQSSEPMEETNAVGVKRQIGDPAGAVRSGEGLAQVTEEVSSTLRCPVCQGMSVADSPSASAVAMKNEISELLEQGYSETQVRDYFESTYGEFVLLDPKREGLNWLLWLAPGGAFFGGLLWILLWNKNRPQRGSADEDLSLYLDQVQAHLEAPSSPPDSGSPNVKTAK